MSNTCKECEEKIFGRSDKLYCSDHCRVSHYNKQNQYSLEVYRKVNKILRSNRRILKSLFENGKKVLNTNALLLHGFKLNYITHLQTNEETLTFFCYDYGIKLIDADEYILVSNNMVPNENQFL